MFSNIQDLKTETYYRMRDLASNGEHSPRTYTTKDGITRTIKGKSEKRGLLPMAESTIWTKVRNGEFPQPIKISERVTAWRRSDIEAWLESKSS